MMSDQYASHLLRVLLNLLAGKDMASNEKLRSKKSQGFKQRNSAAVIVQHQQVQVESIEVVASRSKKKLTRSLSSPASQSHLR